MTMRVLLVGAGGLGCPVAEILARTGPSLPAVRLTVLDDDVVDATNLHRQLLYGELDVGAPKIDRLSAEVRALAAMHRTPLDIQPLSGRFVPENALELSRAHDVLVEGTDNLPSKFLVADAAHLVGRPVVHAGVVRWTGWTKAVVPGASACLRCVFEDVPTDRIETCAEAGVVGPLVGLIGALSAGLLVRLLRGDGSVGQGWTRVDARRGLSRTVPVRRRAACALCGSERRIVDVSPERYVSGCAL